MRELQHIGQFADAEGAVEDEMDDPPPGAVGEGAGKGDRVTHRRYS
jgi:hypothetical protein